MNKNINESIEFLIREYERLKDKKKKNTIRQDEKEALANIKSFLGKK